MSFNNLLKLNSIVADGFLMNDIIHLFKKENQELSEKEFKLLKDDALKFLEYIKKGQKYMSKEKPIDDLDISIKTYSLALKALIDSEEKMTLDRFNDLISSSKEQIHEVIQTKKIKLEKLKDAFYLFDSIRKSLLEKANEISMKEINIF